MINKKNKGILKWERSRIDYAPAVQNNSENKLLTQQKRKNSFPSAELLQSTGTDTDAFAYSNGGIPSALISLPLRYMHTTVEMVQKEDVENVIRLIYETSLDDQSRGLLELF